MALAPLPPITDDDECTLDVRRAHNTAADAIVIRARDLGADETIEVLTAADEIRAHLDRIDPPTESATSRLTTAEANARILGLEQALTGARVRLVAADTRASGDEARIAQLEEDLETARRDLLAAENGEQAAHDAARVIAARYEERLDPVRELDPADLHYAHPAVIRAARAYVDTRSRKGAPVTGRVLEAMTAAIAEALTEPPARPEGAEDVEGALLDADEAGILASDQERIERLADFLATRGVRATGADQ